MNAPIQIILKKEMNEKEKEHAGFLDPTTKSLFLIKEYENDATLSRFQSYWKKESQINSNVW